MPDNNCPDVRSHNMSRIRSKNTKPEDTVCKYLFRRGYRYRKNDKRYPGKPDIVLPKYHTVIFVHGCFWHRHEGCSDYVTPKSSPDYWVPKLDGNRQRYAESIEALHLAGWRVIVVWECEIKKPVQEKRLGRLCQEITAPAIV